jgi:hypothetical protein
MIAGQDPATNPGGLVRESTSLHMKNGPLRFVLLLGVVLPVLAPAQPKWHPGHYVFVGGGALAPGLLALPHFRGVQKAYTWRQFETQPGHYDFSALRADLELVRRHGRQLVMQLTFKSFTRGERNVPDYIQGPAYGGGVYVTVKGGFNPVIWNQRVGERFDALVAALGREFDRDANLEAVNLPETAPNAALDRTPQAGVEAYTDAIYFEALKRRMAALRQAFPNTVVIQYTNFPTKLLEQLTDYELEIGMGMGGPDVYPREEAISHPTRGVYRLYAKLAGQVPLGAAVQSSNYSVALKKRNYLGRGQTMFNGKPIVITDEDELPIPPREFLTLAQEQLKLNYLFWATSPARNFELVKRFLAEPDLAADPAGGLPARLPAKAFRQ